jgi:hypothetical protein
LSGFSHLIKTWLFHKITGKEHSGLNPAFFKLLNDPVFINTFPTGNQKAEPAWFRIRMGFR